MGEQSLLFPNVALLRPCVEAIVRCSRVFATLRRLKETEMANGGSQILTSEQRGAMEQRNFM